MYGFVPMQPPGAHVISNKWKFAIYDRRPESPGAPGTVLYEEDLVASATFTVLDGPLTPTKPIENAAIPPSLRQSIEIVGFRYGNNQEQKSIVGAIRIDKPSVALAFDVFVRYDNREYSAGSIYVPANAVAYYRVESTSSMSAPPGKFDLILRANSAIAGSNKIWNGTLIYVDLPVPMGIGQFPIATQPAPRSVDAGPISTLPSTLKREP
jgi:hypothetical protein